MQNDLLCQNDELFPTVGKDIPFIDSLNANGAKKIWTEEKTAILIGSPPPSDGNKFIAKTRPLKQLLVRL